MNPLLLAIPLVGAETAPPLKTWGDIRFSAESITDVPLDDMGTLSGRTGWGSSRVVAGASYTFPTSPLALRLELEALNGQVLGQGTEVGLARGDDTFLVARDGPRDLARVIPRKAHLAWKPGRLGLRLGADTFGWGLGMLANDGATPRPFGDPLRGNVLGGLGGTWIPWSSGTDPATARALVVFASGDLPIRDDNADLFLGDLGLQDVLGIRYQAPRLQAGAWVGWRFQADRVDPANPRDHRTELHVLPLSGWGHLDLTGPHAPVALDLEGEVAFLSGWSDRPYMVETATEGARVRSLGSVVRLDAARDPLRGTLEVGYASGDNDPKDDVYRTFRFHSDLDVGLVLFEQVLPLMSARAVDRAVDPALAAEPAPGTRFLVANGVENALYVFPVVTFTPMGELEVRAGWLLARSAGDLVDPYSSALNGGWNTTYGGVQQGSHALGQEVDAGIRYPWKLGHGLRLDLAGEGGLWLPGAAFDGIPGLENAFALRARAALAW